MMDYKNMLILASKAVSETVHIGPKTPDTSVGVVEYPSTRVGSGDRTRKINT
jgi:hypothetical protein